MKTTIIAALIAAIAIGGALGAFAATRTVETTAEVDVRVWRRVSDGELYISARPAGSGPDTWITSEALNMSGLNQSGRFHLSSLVTVEVPVEVEVEVGETVPQGSTESLIPEEAPGFTPVAGPCCAVAGMETSPTVREQVVKAVQDVIDFALEEYGITHVGTITINIAYSNSGLLNRYEDAFGVELEELPDNCSFREGEHLFLTATCRDNKRAIATEWFERAVGREDVTPNWIGHGLFDYLLTHYLDGDPPVLTEDRFRRVLFYERARDVRRDRASDDLNTLAMLYAITDYGEFADWRRFYGAVLSGLHAEVAFESVFSATLTEFYADFEEWADHQKIILISTAFSSCREAAANIPRKLDPTATGRGFPDYRVPLEADHDGDRIVCEDTATTPTQ
ncbi:MAG: hypothetical protein F4X03_06170 [Dehalococcoidia bacterium]|nr:hypothetical protein [Dehalococcoidia bacterium]MYD28483.1 hypothetical protein [Dehalococcoidia bacterium]